METLVKRFLQETPLYTLGSLAFLGASLSLILSFLQPILQFMVVSFTVSLLTIAFFLKFGKRNDYPKLLALSAVISGIMLNPLSGAAALFAVSLIFSISAPFLRTNFLYVSAVVAHASDVISTFVLLPSLNEANMVVKLLIEQIGVLEGLLISKFILIVVPLFYAYFEFDEASQLVFVKIVFVLGVSMAFRNFIILFS